MSLQPPPRSPEPDDDPLINFIDRVIKYGGYLRQHRDRLVRSVGHGIKDIAREELGGEEIKDE